jgi:hypothetical protein
MKKVLLYLGIGVIALALIGYVTMQFFLGSAVKAGVNKFGPMMTQSKVELSGATLSPLSGVGTLTGLTVGNPQGWSAEPAFHLGKVHVDMEPFSVFKDYILINEIVIEQPEFNYETKIVASNIGDLLKNIEAAVGGNKAAEPTAKSGQPIKMAIKKFTLKDGTIRLGVGPAAIKLPMPPISLTDIGTAEGGITPARVVFAVMRSVTTSIVSASAQALTKLGGTSGAAAAEGVKQVGEAFKGMFGGKKTEQKTPEPVKK